MNKSTFETRTKSATKNSRGYQIALMLMTDTKKAYTCTTSGKGRFTTNLDYHQDVMNVLCLAGLRKWRDYTEGNESPRGGKTGQFIEITSKGKRKRIK